jgi:uncharacterized protein YbjT (DUF2867 family)
MKGAASHRASRSDLSKITMPPGTLGKAGGARRTLRLNNADAVRPFSLIRARGQGEQAVRAALPATTVIRPAVMFGPDDAFLNALIKLLRRLPVYPMFGRGQTRLQPADVEDVGEAVAKVMQRPGTEPLTVECGGPRVYSYQELLRTLARAANVKPILVPVPFAAWHGLAWIAEIVPGAPVTRNQVELMQIDTVAAPDVPGLAELGISPRPMEEVLESLLRSG